MTESAGWSVSVTDVSAAGRRGSAARDQEPADHLRGEGER